MNSFHKRQYNKVEKHFIIIPEHSCLTIKNLTYVLDVSTTLTDDRKHSPITPSIYWIAQTFHYHSFNNMWIKFLYSKTAPLCLASEVTIFLNSQKGIFLTHKAHLWSPIIKTIKYWAYIEENILSTAMSQITWQTLKITITLIN